MNKVEKDLLKKIEKTDQRRQKYKDRIRKLQKQVMDTETYLVECSIQRDRLQEELRVYRNTVVRVTITDREIEINSFRDKLPELLKKIEGEKKLT